jgi:hypothetical protein
MVFLNCFSHFFRSPEGLIDIVVANEDLQMFSNRAAAALGGRDVASDPSRFNGPSDCPQIPYRDY